MCSFTWRTGKVDTRNQKPDKIEKIRKKIVPYVELDQEKEKTYLLLLQ